MKAYLSITLLCPECNNGMALSDWSRTGRAVFYCGFASCRNFNIKFEVELPTIELKEKRRKKK